MYNLCPLAEAVMVALAQFTVVMMCSMFCFAAVHKDNHRQHNGSKIQALIHE